MPETRANTAGRRTDLLTVELQEVTKKRVWMACCDAIPYQCGSREVSEIEGDNHLGVTLDRRRQDVAVIRSGRVRVSMSVS